jgi:tetratricopeptide (TPR) repeat protein
MTDSSQHSVSRLGAFHLACWIMGLVAFVQLMSIGAAMAFRTGLAGPPEVVTRVETRYLEVEKPVPVPARVLEKAATVAEVKEIIDELINPGEVSEASETMRTAPVIADPVVERLLKEARAARVVGDVVKATLKLQEAENREPRDPSVLYAIAMNYEALQVYDNAADYYLEVHALGPQVAGSLFRKAAEKLGKGVAPEMTELAVLNAVRRLEPEFSPRGEKRTVSLAITTAPQEKFDPDLLHVQVHFFETSDGDLSKAPIDGSDPSATGSLCTTLPYDFSDGEEILHVWYRVPPRERRDRALFGTRDFHGFVAELYYDGRLLDIRAQPRTLVHEIRSQKAASPDSWDPDIDPILDALEQRSAGETLLPKLPGE